MLFIMGLHLNLLILAIILANKKIRLKKYTKTIQAAKADWRFPEYKRNCSLTLGQGLISIVK